MSWYRPQSRCRVDVGNGKERRVSWSWRSETPSSGPWPHTSWPPRPPSWRPPSICNITLKICTIWRLEFHLIVRFLFIVSYDISAGGCNQQLWTVSQTWMEMSRSNSKCDAGQSVTLCHVSRMTGPWPWWRSATAASCRQTLPSPTTIHFNSSWSCLPFSSHDHKEKEGRI